MDTRAILRTTAAVALLALSVPAQNPPPGVPDVGEPGGPTDTLTPGQWTIWLAGREVFDRAFTVDDGVGTPEMNADSCRACHQDPALGGAGGLELNVSRYAHDNGGLGPFVDPPGGQGLSKLRPPLVFGRENYPTTGPEPADVFEQRQTPSALGLGLLDAVPEAEILANEDPTDSNGDGIFGVARVLTIGGGSEIGRFGWKSQVPRLADFVRDAMAGETGITTSDNGRGFGISSDADATGDPELSDTDILNMAFFLRNLGPPLRKNPTDSQVLQGEVIFSTLMCDRCHVPTLQSTLGPVNAYTNLLLHDVMPANYRGMEEPGAPAGFFRTPPLWGIGETAPYMHDGRAEDLVQAIEHHDSEAAASAAGFAALSQSDKDALIAFLEDL